MPPLQVVARIKNIQLKLIPENLYHIYNRGNNSQQIFFRKGNYEYFLKKILKYVLPHCNIFSYCLMPNHFHLMVFFKPKFNENEFTQNLRTLLSSYTRAVNHEKKRTGSLFQQNTRAKCLNYSTARSNYALTCFHYIHQNPLIRGLVKKMEEWKFSSFREYIGLSENPICDIDQAKDLLGLPDNNKEFYRQSYNIISDDKIKNLFK